jgi:hypothetical protein
MGTLSPLAPGGIVEEARHFTALGIRFWDQALNRPVNDGLVVEAWQENGDTPAARAVRTRGGVYAFHELAGQREIERIVFQETAAGSLPDSSERISYVITVEDRLGRYLPVVFGVRLPLDYRGIFLSGAAGSLPAGAGRAVLFSSPARRTPPGSSAVRADLWDAEADSPAAFAAVRITVAGAVWPGIADERGRVLVVFPTPLLQKLRLGSLPGGAEPDAPATWPVAVRVNYEPAALQDYFPLRGRRGVPSPWKDLPSLKGVLERQSPAPILERDANPQLRVAVLNRQLTHREPLVLKTEMDNPAEDASRLLVSAAGGSLP